METIIILTALIALLICRTPVAAALGGLGVVLLYLKELPLVSVPQRLYGTMDSFELLAVPMFLLMSNILLRAGVGKDLYSAVQSWVGHWPGGLSVATILSCTIFSAISGSSVATAATIGTVAIPEMTKRGYDRTFVLGMLAAGGTLGILIPPSIPLIIYGVVTETSIPTLFLAGIGPGLFLAMLFIVYGVSYSHLYGNQRSDEKAAWRVRLRETLKVLPLLILATTIIGSIYTGVATPSESAGLGFVLSIIITVSMRRMDWDKIKEATYTAMKTTVMVFLIVAGAKVFSYAITLYLIPQSISQFLTSNISDPGLFMLAVGSTLLIIGFFLEALSMLLIMVPVLFPALEAMSIDPIWFGIFFVILIETALITPPVGVNLYIVHGVRDGGTMNDVIIGASPFVVTMFVMICLLVAFPKIALFLPQMFY